MKPLYILKIGGSVATHKDRQGESVRSALMKKVAVAIQKGKKEKDFDLILIHGAGAAGHQIAHHYRLQTGTGNDPQKWQGSLLCQIANQKLNRAITEILISKKLKATPVHTASVIIQKNKAIDFFNILPIKTALNNNCIPILYGEMVFDSKLGMTICSGDAIAAYLARRLKAQKVFFASDVDGIFTQDPHLFQDAQLIQMINLADIRKKALASQSHNTDVTGGISGKIDRLKLLRKSKVQTVEIFNGIRSENYYLALLGKNFPHTKIRF